MTSMGEWIIPDLTAWTELFCHLRYRNSFVHSGARSTYTIYLFLGKDHWSTQQINVIVTSFSWFIEKNQVIYMHIWCKTRRAQGCDQTGATGALQQWSGTVWVEVTRCSTLCMVQARRHLSTGECSWPAHSSHPNVKCSRPRLFKQECSDLGS